MGWTTECSTSGVKVKLYTGAMLVYYTPGHQAHADLAKPPLRKAGSNHAIMTKHSLRAATGHSLRFELNREFLVASWQLDTDTDAGFLRKKSEPMLDRSARSSWEFLASVCRVQNLQTVLSLVKQMHHSKNQHRSGAGLVGLWGRLVVEPPTNQCINCSLLMHMKWHEYKLNTYERIKALKWILHYLELQYIQASPESSDFRIWNHTVNSVGIFCILLSLCIWDNSHKKVITYTLYTEDVKAKVLSAWKLALSAESVEIWCTMDSDGSCKMDDMYP